MLGHPPAQIVLLALLAGLALAGTSEQLLASYPLRGGVSFATWRRVPSAVSYSLCSYPNAVLSFDTSFTEDRELESPLVSLRQMRSHRATSRRSLTQVRYEVVIVGADSGPCTAPGNDRRVLLSAFMCPASGVVSSCAAAPSPATAWDAAVDTANQLVTRSLLVTDTAFIHGYDFTSTHLFHNDMITPFADDQDAWGVAEIRVYATSTALSHDTDSSMCSPGFVVEYNARLDEGTDPAITCELRRVNALTPPRMLCSQADTATPVQLVLDNLRAHSEVEVVAAIAQDGADYSTEVDVSVSIDGTPAWTSTVSRSAQECFPEARGCANPQPGTSGTQTPGDVSASVAVYPSIRTQAVAHTSGSVRVDVMKPSAQTSALLGITSLAVCVRPAASATLPPGVVASVVVAIVLSYGIVAVVMTVHRRSRRQDRGSPRQNSAQQAEKAVSHDKQC